MKDILEAQIEESESRVQFMCSTSSPLQTYELEEDSPLSSHYSSFRGGEIPTISAQDNFVNSWRHQMESFLKLHSLKHIEACIDEDTAAPPIQSTVTISADYSQESSSDPAPPPARNLKVSCSRGDTARDEKAVLSHAEKLKIAYIDQTKKLTLMD